MLEQINRVLNIIMGSSVGVLIGHGVYVYLDYKAHTDLYAMRSAPWYTSILVYGIVTLITLIICFVIKLVVRKKMGNGGTLCL